MTDAETIFDLRRSFAAALATDDHVKARERLVAAGWLDALGADERTAVSIVFRLQGSTRRDAAALDDVVVARLASTWPAASIGDVAVAYPMIGGPRRDGPTHVVLEARRGAGRLLWLDDGDDRLTIIDLASGLDGTTLIGIDPDYGLIGLSEPPPGDVATFSGPPAADAWDHALASARIAVAHQLIGGSLAMLEMAVDHATAREQFGTPIGTFQAVQHRLAETLVAISAADASAVAAATEPTATNAALAKALAGRAAEVAARNCLQVLGGIGFTFEHDFHLYFRRNLVLDRLVGDTTSILRDLGARLRCGELSVDRIIDIDQLPAIEHLGPPTKRS